MNAQADDASKYLKLTAEKAEKLADLMKRKPADKRYKASLKAFLEADAKARNALIKRIERQTGARKASADPASGPEAHS